ncbi:ester cyclase [Streptomyces sp. RKND-216]|uniref:ester cyclase n=1 Tax=Streptomyces sp. RKND-216 TaxID=2562581 RepID=UPI00109E22FB|nr:ester cyclase [Streptomyces sp. RKND-216]THA24930.1 ester cyclase [Streptomyces sp. RKND-216]
MTFLQLIDCRTDRFEEMNRLMDTWAEQTRGKRTATHEVVGRDRSDGAHFVEIVEFPSYEEAMRNSELPETDRVFREMVALCDGMPTFTDLDVVRDETFNAETMRRFYEEVAVGGNIDVIDELYIPDHIDHDVAKEANTTVGRDVLKADITRWREAFDFDFTLDRQVAEGDTVVTLWTWRGRHRGDFMGIAPTGRECTMTGTTVCRFQDGKIHESWWHYDIPRLMRELGAEASA